MEKERRGVEWRRDRLARERRQRRIDAELGGKENNVAVELGGAGTVIVLIPKSNSILEPNMEWAYSTPICGPNMPHKFL